MPPLLVVLLRPAVQIELQFIKGAMDLLAEDHPVKLIQHRLVEPFTNAVGLEMTGLGPRVINVLDG